MAVQFIIGRAGTGKTQYCVNALSAASNADPLGPPLFWIMPEQATFMSEQRLIAAPDFSGSFRIHVVGFRQLCRLLATELKLTLGREISPIGRQLLLARTVHACRERLTAYQKVASLPGFLASLDRTLRELIQARQSAEQLRMAARTLQTQVPHNQWHIGGALLADKLHDLALLLESWDHVRPANDFDAEMLPTIIENAMARVERLKGTSVYVDAFSSMSVMEMELLSLLAKRADTLVITLLADPASPVFSDPLAAPAALGVFHRTEQLYQRLMRQFQISGVAVENPIFLHTPHRFRRCPALAHLESQLFNGDFNPSPPITSDRAVELLACPSPEEEVLDAGRRIQAMVAGGMRYREIGVVVTDLVAYAPLIDTTFAALKIPFFLDQRQSLKFHPLVDFLRSLTTLTQRDCSRADILSLVKTSLTGMSSVQLYTLENYFLAHGIQRDTLDSDWQWKQLPADEENDQPSADDIKNLKEINATRRQLRRALEPWIAVNSKAQHPQPIAAFALSVITVLDSMHVGKIMEQWIQQALSDGAPELAQIHQQAWSECLDMLREMAALSENHAHSAAEFSQLLQTLLDNLTLGLIPPAVDQVLISSAQRSRHPELKAVIIIGALETMMPRVAAEDGMINNADRRQLKPILGDALNPDTAEDFMEAAFFDYVAFTRAAEKLIISYPAADADGRKTSPSIYMNRIGALFRDVSTTFMESADIRWPDFAALDELIRWVLLEAADGNPGLSKRPDSARIALAQQWLAGHGDPAVRRRWQRALAAQNRTAIPPLPEDLGRLSLGPAVFSVSELETYAACPLRHFYQYTLRLRQRPQWQIDARNLGMMYHKALEVFYRAVIDGSLPWPDCAEKQFTKILSDAIAESTRALAADAIADALELQAIVKPMQRHLGIILEAQRRAAQGNHLRAVATELHFGNFSDNHGASQMSSAIELGDAGQSLLLRGKIDRLDVDPAGNAMLVDYKSGAKTFHFGYFLQGLDLQLVAYMLAVHGGSINGIGPLKPIGAFYYPLRPPEVSAPTGKDQNTLTPADSQYYKKCKPDGPFDNSAIDILDSRVEAGQSSAWFKISLTKDGKPHAKANGGLEHALFAATLNAGFQIMCRIAQEIREGHIAPLPFRAGTTTPCDTCDFKSICPFDRQRGRYRTIETSAKQALSEFQEKLTTKSVEQQ